MWGITYFGVSEFGANFWGSSSAPPVTDPDYFGLNYFGLNEFGSYWQSTGATPTAQYFEQALQAKLNAITALTDIVGDSIYTQALPQTHDCGRDGSAVSYSIPTKPRGHVLTGSDGTATATVQLDAWSYEYGTSKQILESIRNSIDGPPGVWGDGSCTIVWVVQQDDIDASESPKSGTDQWLYHLITEYRVMYRVTKPTLS